MGSFFARLARRYGPRVDAATRRDFLRATLAASAGVLLSDSFSLAQDKPKGKRVVVIGGGFSGLACAHELKSAGYSVTVLEARERFGGRVLSFSDMVKGRNVEGGGELIGSNHPTWVAYAEKFGLEFLDVTEEEEGMTMPIVFGGKRLDDEEGAKLYEEMDGSFNLLNAKAEPIDVDQPWKSPNAAALDKANMAGWIAELKISDVAKAATTVQLASDNGVAVERQSFLGMLAAIAGGGGEKYWTDSEVYRCAGGNQQLALKLADAIGKASVTTGLAVSEVKVSESVKVVCRDGRVIEADDVVLAVPPGVYKKIEFSPPLPATLQTQMGVNTKYLMGFKKRFWLEKKLSQYALTDGVFSQTWEATDQQEGEGGAALVGFSGGPSGELIRKLPAATRDKSLADIMEKLYPGYAENLEGKPRFMDWPSDQWTMASYSFPAPGQVTAIGPLFYKGLGRLHFAGEHTCYKFVGYMEGALNSGASLAKRLAMRDGLIKP